MRRPLLLFALLGACGTDPTPTTTPDAQVGPGPTPPAEVAARTQVRFEVTGTGAFLVSRGRSCAVFEVEREVSAGQWERVPLDVGVTCVCECQPPGAPTAIEYEPLDATMPVAVRWDGRRMAFVQRAVDCSTRSFTGRGTATEYVGAPQPLPAGRYRVSFATAPSVPGGCQKLMSGFWCPPTTTVGMPAPGPFALCPGTRVTATFELPESGAVTVPVRVGG
jgi:hypothetical protein